jgi:hypothetical protein
VITLKLKTTVKMKKAVLVQLHKLGYELLVPATWAAQWRTAVSNYYTDDVFNRPFCTKKVEGGGVLIYPNPKPRLPVPAHLLRRAPTRLYEQCVCK